MECQSYESRDRDLGNIFELICILTTLSYIYDMKDIRDYLHLYTGCKISTPYGECKFLYFKSDLDPREYNQVICDRGDNVFAFTLGEVKLILRPPESMSDEEAKEIGWCDDEEPRIAYIEYFKQRYMFSADTMLYLLRKGFDIFGLKDDGLAVYENDKI